ncbi:MAG: PilN domain-containing protein [Syntrophobacterales bacterium]|jgi:type IV pilus assembly protein PilN|nr:PilN domain-containing protein [Syntrophobacterales bacterium]
MIKVNLLPYRERKKKDLWKRQIFVASATFGAFLLIIATLHGYIYFSVNGLERDVKAAEGRLEELNKLAAEFNSVKADKDLLAKKIEVINNLEKSRMDVVLLLNEVARTIPPGQVWLVLLAETGSNLRIDGIARDNLAVAVFMNNLERSALIKSVDLSASKQDKIANTKVQKFVLNCSLKKG